MDVAAYELALRWINTCGDPHPWLPLAGRSAADAMHDHHAARYRDRTYFEASRVSKAIANDRSDAREAFDRLCKTFSQYGMELGGNKLSLAEIFLLTANGDAKSDIKILRRISRLLITGLGSDERPQSLQIADACNRFLRHRRLSELEKDLAEVAGKASTN